MKATIEGLCLGGKDWTDKATQMTKGQIDVYVDSEVVSVPTLEHEKYPRYRFVRVTGDLNKYEREWYFKGEPTIEIMEDAADVPLTPTLKVG